jgi:uncharacterized OsmC-like protein
VPNEAEIRTVGSQVSAAEPASILIKHPRAGVAEMRIGEFSGGRLLDLALAGCVFNNLLRTAAERGIRIHEAGVLVIGDFSDDGSSPGIKCRVKVLGDAGPDQLRALAREAFDDSTVAGVVKRSGQVEFQGP